MGLPLAPLPLEIAPGIGGGPPSGVPVPAGKGELWIASPDPGVRQVRPRHLPTAMLDCRGIELRRLSASFSTVDSLLPDGPV